MKKYFLLSIVIVALAAGSYFTEQPFLVPNKTTAVASPAVADTSAPRSGGAPMSGAQKTPAPSAPTAPAPNVTLVAGNDSYKTFIPAGSNVLDLMRTLSSSTSFTFTSREYPSLGFFIDSINGKNNGGGYYWFLYVNGTSSDTGASQTILKVGDTVEWRYGKNH